MFFIVRRSYIIRFFCDLNWIEEVNVVRVERRLENFRGF